MAIRCGGRSLPSQGPLAAGKLRAPGGSGQQFVLCSVFQPSFAAAAHFFVSSYLLQDAGVAWAQLAPLLGSLGAFLMLPFKNRSIWGLPEGLGTKTPRSHCRGPGFNPWLGN